MRTTLAVAVFALLGCVGAEAQPLAPSPQFQASMDLVAALRSRDIAKVMGVLTDDAVILPPGRDIAGGRREIEALVKDFLAKNTVELAFSSLGSSGGGNLGYDLGQYELTLKPEGGGAKTKSRGKYLAVFRQDTQERWRLGCLSWNSSDPAAPPPTPAPSATPAPSVK
jgi:ketosteroid isomerase-like protein